MLSISMDSLSTKYMRALHSPRLERVFQSSLHTHMEYFLHTVSSDLFKGVAGDS